MTERIAYYDYESFFPIENVYIKSIKSYNLIIEQLQIFLRDKIFTSRKFTWNYLRYTDPSISNHYETILTIGHLLSLKADISEK